ncbi:MAG TPA: MCE family protein [Egibacteraceae bacterium]|nr:MCE family protein [Egibacteraceae bacterium]
MMRRLPIVVLLVLALAIPACGRQEPFVLNAQFEDVADLVEGNAVQLADVRVGTIKSIELTDDLAAMVTMHLDPQVALPSRVSARLRKTNVLGERFVELVPDRSSGGRLESGAVITDTRLVADLEDVVRTGSELLAAVTAETVAGAIEAGARGVGGRGETFGQVLDDLTQIISSYDRNSEDIVRLIDGLDAFLADVGPEAQLHGDAFTELARAARVLNEEDERLLDAVDDIRELAITGEDIMTTHRERTDVFFDRFNRITAEITRRNEDLDRLFYEVYKHNFNTIRGVNNEMGQILLDLIVCGENDTPGDRVRGCEDLPQSGPRPSGRGGGEKR